MSMDQLSGAIVDTRLGEARTQGERLAFGAINLLSRNEQFFHVFNNFYSNPAIDTLYQAFIDRLGLLLKFPKLEFALGESGHNHPDNDGNSPLDVQEMFGADLYRLTRDKITPQTPVTHSSVRISRVIAVDEVKVPSIVQYSEWFFPTDLDTTNGSNSISDGLQIVHLMQREQPKE